MNRMTITKTNREEESLQERLIEEILNDASKELIKREMLPIEEDCDYEPSKEFKKSMERILKRAERKAWWQGNYITIAKGAASIMIVGVVASVTVMNVEAFKVPVFNFFMENQEKYSKLEVREEGKEEEYDYKTLLKEYPGIAVLVDVPKGYSYVRTDGVKGQYTTIYSDKNENQIILLQFQEKGVWDLNTEQEILYEMEYDGIKYKVLEVGGLITTVWEKDGYTYNLSGILTKQEIQKIIGNIYYSKEK